MFKPPYNFQLTGLIERHNGIWNVVFRKQFQEPQTSFHYKLIYVQDIAHQASAYKKAVSLGYAGMAHTFFTYIQNPRFKDWKQSSVGDDRDGNIEDTAEPRREPRRTTLKAVHNTHRASQMMHFLEKKAENSRTYNRRKEIGVLIRKPRKNDRVPYWGTSSVNDGKRM